MEEKSKNLTPTPKREKNPDIRLKQIFWKN